MRNRRPFRVGDLIRDTYKGSIGFVYKITKTGKIFVYWTPTDSGPEYWWAGELYAYSDWLIVEDKP